MRNRIKYGVLTLRIWLLIFLVWASVLLRPVLPQEKPIERNHAWNDMMNQFKAIHENMNVLGHFMVDHQTEYKVTEYSIPTFKAIDAAEEELKAAEKDLQKIRSELEYKEEAKK